MHFLTTKSFVQLNPKVCWGFFFGKFLQKTLCKCHDLHQRVGAWLHYDFMPQWHWQVNSCRGTITGLGTTWIDGWEDKLLKKWHFLSLMDGEVKYFLLSCCQTCTPLFLRPLWIDCLPFPPHTLFQERVDFISHGGGIVRVEGGGGGRGGGEERGWVQKKPGSSCSPNEDGDRKTCFLSTRRRSARRRWRTRGWSATTEMAQRKQDPALGSAISSRGSPAIFTESFFRSLQLLALGQPLISGAASPLGP